MSHSPRRSKNGGDHEYGSKRTVVQPEELRPWLSSEPEDQLNISFQLASKAFKGAQQMYEVELKALRNQLEDVQRQYSGAQKKMTELEHELIDSQRRYSQSKDEITHLNLKVRKLQTRNSHLENLRKSVLVSMQDATCEEDSNEFLPALGLQYSANESGSLSRFAEKNHDPHANTAHASPSVRKSAVPSRSSSKEPGGDNPQARHFFKLVKTRLEYDRFESFILIVRDLNENKISAEVATNSVRDLLGPDNSDLFADFKSILLKVNRVSVDQSIEKC